VYSDDAVIKNYLASDRRIFEIPCASCGAFHAPSWADIVWDTGQPQTAAYKCPHCFELIEERFKASMVEQGVWRATAPFTGHAGFKINVLTSTLHNARWSKIVEEFLASKDDASLLQVFFNTLLAEPFSNATDELDENQIAKKAESFSLDAIPDDVISITSGTDLGDTYADTVFVGHTKDGAQYVLGQVVTHGSPQDESFWQEIDGLLRREYDHPLGGKMRLDASIIDSGDGEHTSKCYDYTRPRLHRRVFSGKGMSGNRPTATRSHVKQTTLIVIGVDGIKATLYGNIAAGKKIKFSNTLEARYYEELASERRVLKYYKGQPSRQWIRKSGMRAESLDATVYGICARSLVTLNFDTRASELKLEPTPVKQATVFRSDWIDRLKHN
jgi:phage terminase large subunit GpA-like protein